MGPSSGEWASRRAMMARRLFSKEIREGHFRATKAGFNLRHRN
jgi:hypothetical protein